MAGFGKNSGPSTPSSQQQFQFGNFPTFSSSSSPRPISPTFNNVSPPQPPHRGSVTSHGMQSHPWDFSSNSVEDLNPPFEEAQRFPTKPTHFQAPKRSRSPPLLPANEVHWRNSDVDRAFASPPRIGDTTNSFIKNANSTTQQRSSSFSLILDAKGSGAKITNSQVAKRTRSPPVSYDDVYGDDVDPGTLYSSRDDTEREVQAKAKRLARFNVELSQPVQSSLDPLKHKFQGNRHDIIEERQKVGAKQPIEETGDLMLPDNEGLEPSTVIIGLCPDMCPESERAERERKGDLDKYERLDGDRNQTTRFLAVKKYTRTAEREADLIRPMPVLRNTIDYLLNLLDKPYDERFLAMYNFLWDRMRAIRMDLRMQHIFDHDAITMLEQMIRLHIIAMHELCEYTKGEGFSEGFDAHLNIEQMNKTSVELFQMYDDHRKKGRIVPSEKEFRGYYALLKLDKHPGYKVEPAELSLDLAKMTPEIRQTPEILFAREVARACRTGNFIAFFRLARKATYLQACLMHAHFAKLRTQALASLHSGLQNNQGIPVSHITKWLGMEEEDIENLLEYHGFLIKEFEESYMVKEGPFLNSDKDYQTKCSLLVHLKKSRRIVDDVSSFDLLGLPAEQSKQVVLDKVGKLNSKAIPVVRPKALVRAVDEEMLDRGEDHTPIHDSQVKPVLEISSITDQMVGSVPQVSQAWDITPINHSPHSTPAKVGIVSKPAQMTSRNNSLERNLHLNLKEMPLQSMIGRAPEVEGALASSNECQVESPAPERLATGSPETDEVMVTHQVVEDEAVVVLHEEIENEEDFTAQEEKEIAAAKLKLIIRTWRRHSLKRRELRELRQLAANAALASLSFGLPIQQMNAQPSHVSELDIDWTVRERHERHRRSWSRLNISEVVSEILSERYTYSKCLCWKLIVCSGTNDTGGDRLRQMSQSDHLASLWLHSKLLGVRGEKDDELVVSYTGLSIWKKWVTSKYQSFPTCCLSVIREAKFDELDNTLGGTDAVVFLISEIISLEFQKDRLCRLLMSLPKGSPVPLLILSCTFKEEIANPSSIANRLGLHFMDQKKISRFSVISLGKDQQPDNLDGFFSSDCLVEGIQWLASQSPLHPLLHCTKTRELVMDHLGSSLDVLEKIDVSVVGPNHCISAFNNALDESAEEVVTAANTNAASWPCPEINLLEELSDEFRAVKIYMPVVGWSSATNIEPILKRFQGCKLPFFPDDLSWLNNGSDTGEEILNQKSELQKCLIRYLTLSSKMMDVALATTEACVMLQKGAILELQGSNYHIKPRWVAIFRRIFNWQLTNLTSGAPSVAYVLEQPSVVESHSIVIPSNSCMREFNLSIASPSLKDTDRLKLNAASPAYTFAQPCLDEMIAVCCNTQQSGREQSETRAIRPLSGIAGNANQVLDVAMTTDIVDDNEKFRQEVSIQTRDALSPSHLSEGMVVATKGKKEADKLSQLLKQCNMLQDTIDEKLSIYF